MKLVFPWVGVSEWQGFPGQCFPPLSFLSSMGRNLTLKGSAQLCFVPFQFQSPEQLDPPLLEFPYCILQLQADIRKVGLQTAPTRRQSYATMACLSLKEIPVHVVESSFKVRPTISVDSAHFIR